MDFQRGLKGKPGPLNTTDTYHVVSQTHPDPPKAILSARFRVGFWLALDFAEPEDPGRGAEGGGQGGANMATGNIPI